MTDGQGKQNQIEFLNGLSLHPVHSNYTIMPPDRVNTTTYPVLVLHVQPFGNAVNNVKMYTYIFSWCNDGFIGHHDKINPILYIPWLCEFVNVFNCCYLLKDNYSLKEHGDARILNYTRRNINKIFI